MNNENFIISLERNTAHTPGGNPKITNSLLICRSTPDGTIKSSRTFSTTTVKGKKKRRRTFSRKSWKEAA